MIAWLTDPKVMDAMKNLGVPTALLAVLTFGLWQSAAWTGTHVLTPLVDQQVHFMKELSKSNNDNIGILRDISDTLQEIQKTESQQEKLMEKMHNDAPPR